MAAFATVDAAYAEPAPTLTTAQQQHVQDEYANCLAQRRCTPLPTATRTPTPTATGTPVPPTPTATPTVATDTPTATPTAGPPCWTDDDGNRWLVVDDAVYFDTDGVPVACPDPLATPGPEAEPPAAEDPVPFVQPTILPPPTPVIQVVHEITIIHDLAPQAAAVADTPEPVPSDTPTATPTDIPAATDTPTPAATASPTVPSTSTPPPSPTPAPTREAPVVPLPSEPPVAPKPAKPQQHLPPVAYQPEVAPERHYLWPLPVVTAPSTDYNTHAYPQTIPPQIASGGWVQDEASDYPYAGAKSYTRWERAAPVTVPYAGGYWTSETGRHEVPE